MSSFCGLGILARVCFVGLLRALIDVRVDQRLALTLGEADFVFVRRGDGAVLLEPFIARHQAEQLVLQAAVKRICYNLRRICGGIGGA